MAVTELLASVDDINTHLPTDKLDANASVAEDEINLAEVDAARLVRSMLAGVFTTVTLASWSDPDSTPDLIRGIAGRIIAAKYYSVRYAEDSDESVYAASLYKEAMNMIQTIRGGSMIVLDADGEVLTTESNPGMTADDFWPNNSSPAPKFTMDKEFA